MIEGFEKQKVEQKSEGNKSLDLRILSNQTNKEIDDQKEKLVKAVEEKNTEDIKMEYKKMVEILAQKLAIETKVIDQKIQKQDIGVESKKQFLLEKTSLVEDFYKTINILAHQIEEIVPEELNNNNESR